MIDGTPDSPGGSPPVAAPLAAAHRARLAFLSGRPAWLALALVVTALLVAGSVHGRAGPSSRVAYLESVIKCPSCEDLTIAQSDTPSALHLRTLVTGWVAGGRSNAWIEQQVVDRFGSAELLSPQGSGLDAALFVVPLAALGVASSGLGWFLVRRRDGPPEPGRGAVAGQPDDEARVREALELAALHDGGRP